jgi:ribosomal protein L37AE/L43A
MSNKNREFSSEQIDEMMSWDSPSFQKSAGDSRTMEPPVCPECGCSYAIETEVPGVLLCHDCATEFPEPGVKTDPRVVETKSASTFDKFMDVVLICETRKRKTEHPDTPQRVYNKKYRELPGNRIRMQVK